MESGAAALRTVFGAHQGTVIEFDARVGSGRVRDSGGHAWAFHCTSIADGSREIPAGVAATFRVEPGPLGIEAFEVCSLS